MSSGRREPTRPKHDPPKSLRGTDDADFVWSLITERFPNAAPLLCEMEAVIDRAEDLLRQLRAPCQNDIETSDFALAQDSDESSPLISARGSFTEYNVVEEEECTEKNIETQISVNSIFERETDLNSRSVSQCLGSRDLEYSGNPSSESSTMQYSTAETNGNFENTLPSKLETPSERVTREANSLEEWEKLACNAMYESISDVADINDISKEERDFNEKCMEEETGTPGNASDDAREVSNATQHRRERDVDVGDFRIGREYDENINDRELEESKVDAMNILYQGSGDESTAKLPGRRTPLNIIEEYANRCKVPVVYQYKPDSPHRHKSNVYVIRGDLAGFAATSQGETEALAKNSLARKILCMIADRQMNDEKLINLKELTREEMLEIIELDVETTRETAQRKLYKLCIEKGEQVPKYSVDKEKTFQGYMYVCRCTALGYIGEGRGVRECVAKKVAADELYRQYFQTRNSKSKVLNYPNMVLLPPSRNCYDFPFQSPAQNPIGISLSLDVAPVRRVTAVVQVRRRFLQRAIPRMNRRLLTYYTRVEVLSMLSFPTDNKIVTVQPVERIVIMGRSTSTCSSFSTYKENFVQEFIGLGGYDIIIIISGFTDVLYDVG